MYKVDEVAKLLTVARVAERLAVSQRTVYGLVKLGKLECYRIAAHNNRGVIRFSREQIEAFLAGTVPQTRDLPVAAPRSRAPKLKHLHV